MVYDEFDEEANQIIEPIRHDTANYDEEFIAGRGNLTSVTRHDVLSQSSPVTSTIRYDIAGSVVARLDPLDRKVRLEYTDAFNDSSTPGTFAYPTKVYDPAGNFSTVKYRFDIGANVEATSPAPAGQTYGKTSKRIFDSIGRLQKNSVYVNTTEKSYVRYEYPSNGIQSKVFAPIVDQDGDGDIAEDEVYSESWHDGAGRVRMSRTEHPGSSGGWASSFVEYDILGRVKRQSVPTETNSGYAPAGDDTGGPLWTYLKYDWMGRVIRKINTDGVDDPTPNDSDIFISYEGCGCAGGLVTTIEGELVPRTDTSGDARRKTKSYADILGRTFKTETYEWDGETVYSTVLQSFDGADRPVRTRQFAGTTSSETYQDTTATFDGHGRLASSHRPEQMDAEQDPTFTTYTYNPDDSLHVKTDARGATSTMTYNSRGLVTNVENEWPGGTPLLNRKNFALQSNGGTASASSTSSGSYPASAAINGDRTGAAWGTSTGGWMDGTNGNWPDSLQVDFGGERTIDEIVVTTLQDNYTSGLEPTEQTTFINYGIFTYEVQYWDGDSWETVSGGTVSFTTKVMKRFQFSPITTSKIRVVVHHGQLSRSRIVELEAWGNAEPAPPPINTETSFTYDDLGNRVTMTDDQGSTAYSYDPLSRLIDETRSFTDTLPNAPLSNNSFKIEYGYNLSGSLKSITDPFGDEIEYASDKAGRLTDVTGSSYANLTEYATGAEYRAWGGLKALEYGNGVQTATTFNSRLLPNAHELVGPGSTQIMDKSYQYYKDGRLKFVDDAINGVFDRMQTYDHAGRVKEGKSGAEASGGSVATEDQETQLPYRQSYGFNAFGNMTERNNLHWGKDYWYGQNNNLSYTYENNRVTNSYWQYDTDGRVLNTAPPDDSTSSVYDARGLLVQYHLQNPNGDYITHRYYNGDGREVKRLKQKMELSDVDWVTQEPEYFIRSSVLGGETITEIGPTGKKKSTFVIAAGAKIATQSQYTYNNTDHESVAWDHSDASGMSRRSTMSTGVTIVGDGQFEGAPAELDPLGGNVGTVTPYVEIELQLPPESPTGDWGFIPIQSDAPMYVNGQQVTGYLDGMGVPCSMAMQALESGTAIPAALAPYQHLPGFNFTSHGMGIYTWNIPGYTFSTPNGPNPSNPNDPDAPINIGSEGYQPPQTGSLYFNVSWNPSQSNRIDTPKDKLLKRASELAAAENRNDCLALVELFRYAGQIFPNVTEATSSLAEVVGDGDFWRLLVDGAANYLDYSSRRDPPVWFGISGFKSSPDLRGAVGSNQVRHFMAGFIGAATLGTGRALREMNAIEIGTSDDNEADRRLNVISTDLGGLVQAHNSRYLRASGPHTAEFMNKIADEIKSRACE